MPLALPRRTQVVAACKLLVLTPPDVILLRGKWREGRCSWRAWNLERVRRNTGSRVVGIGLVC